MVNEELGFSLWLDFIERDFLQEEFKRLIEEGVINGATSNPMISRDRGCACSNNTGSPRGAAGTRSCPRWSTVGSGWSPWPPTRPAPAYAGGG